MLAQLYLLHLASYFLVGGYLYSPWFSAIKINKPSVSVSDMKWILFGNMGVITPILGYLFAPYMNLTIPKLTPLLGLSLLVEIILTTQFTNLLFTIFHLILHTSWGMKYIHYLHHRMRISHGLGAFYAHPIEHIIANTLPALLSLVLFASNAISIGLFILITTSNTVIAHTAFSRVPNNISYHHNFHHKYGIKNYGFSPYTLDRLLSTYHGYQKKIK